MYKKANYKCSHCGKIVTRKFTKDEFEKMWIKSFCEESGLLVHMYKLNYISKKKLTN